MLVVKRVLGICLFIFKFNMKFFLIFSYLFPFRILQKYLDKISPEGLDYLINKFSNKFPNLMVDTYGNYFCQKLIQSCSSEQRIMILKDVR